MVLLKGNAKCEELLSMYRYLLTDDMVALQLEL